jgi:pSer/pThr/pTyr-binding forkhead associated (FHA) protein
MTVKLALYQQDSKVQEFVLDGTDHVIGRSDEADVTLNDRWVSRRHCRIEVREGQVTVHDLGSTHGTFVNDRPISAARLFDGDSLVVGLSRLVADCGSSQEVSHLQVASQTREGLPE